MKSREIAVIIVEGYVHDNDDQNNTLYGYLATFMIKRKLSVEPDGSTITTVSKFPEGDHHLHIPKAYPELDDSSDSEPDDDNDDFRELLMKCVGGEKDTVSFLNTFSSAKRRKIHNICDQLTIVQKSTVEGDLRRLVVTRVPLTPHGVICVIPSVFPTVRVVRDLTSLMPATPTMTEGWIGQMPRSKRVRKSVNYAESDLSSLTEPNSQVYDTSRRRSRRARDQLPFSPASPSVVEIAPERASSRSSMPPLEPIFPPTLPSAEEESSRASSPYNFCFQHELEASYA
ncbi:hypothetical protein DAPPUDRAFT_250330 [Daphnia pulex]|uniref:R3H domain-containing protein n=1 Tax=Daphnia pulex TaxID=6669 RepID=E9GYC1_DAPPU|nr:hypothetical protein DAPPUDRAFT_250330 [Daphnia pulex]|eukprot:EFX75575.1 hypothetical protein DAPPUDRAFT_250330 [Daphnia pulex]